MGMQAYEALMTAAVKCNEAELAVDVYRQMQAEHMGCPAPVFTMMVEVFVKAGAIQVHTPYLLSWYHPAQVQIGSSAKAHGADP